jgi:hypothetical protein
MGRALVAVGALLALLVLGLAAVAVLGQEDPRLAVDNLLSEDLTRAVGTAEERRAEVVVADLTRFRWERMLLAERGAPREAIARELGTEWTGDVGFRAGDLLIFVNDGEVVRFADYRGEGRFEGMERPFAWFEPETAVFTVDDLVIRPAR